MAEVIINLMFFYDDNGSQKLWIHLHGFATDVSGSKIALLRERFKKEKSYSFFAMDMDYHTHTTSQVLETLEALVCGFSRRYKDIVMCGSSHGAYVSANYVRFRELCNLKRLVLLAPSFRTLGLILEEVGQEKAKPWLEGKEPLKLLEGDIEIEVIPEFARDIIEKDYEVLQKGKVNFPKDPPVEIFIVHGKFDEVVPIEDTYAFVKEVKVERFLEVEDDHSLSMNFESYISELV